MPERLECEVLQKARYINTLTYLPTYYRIKFRKMRRSVERCLANTRVTRRYKEKCSSRYKVQAIDWRHINNRGLIMA